MQHQYWVTKKSVLRKLGGKEDECIVSSDAELDAKLELFRSISESCIQLQRVIDLYQERLCVLAQEENALGRYMKECGKNERNSSAGHIMTIVGKSLAYNGHQRLTIRPPLVRLHHEVETFRQRAVSDTRATIIEMEKARTEYRAALSWMKSASTQLDPDTGHGLEKFRKAQSYVRSSKVRFDRMMLACLQKVDLLAAARCNMFSHALVSYQSSIQNFSSKALESLSSVANKLNNVNKPNEDICCSATNNQEDKVQNTFFNPEYTDESQDQNSAAKPNEEKTTTSNDDENLLGEDFSSHKEDEKGESPSSQKGEVEGEEQLASSALLDLQWPSYTASYTGATNNNDNFILGGGEFMPSQLIQAGNLNFTLQPSESKTPSPNKTGEEAQQDEAKNMMNKNSVAASSAAATAKKNNTADKNMSWLSLFAELDPLANQENEGLNVGDKL